MLEGVDRDWPRYLASQRLWSTAHVLRISQPEASSATGPSRRVSGYAAQWYLLNRFLRGAGPPFEHSANPRLQADQAQAASASPNALQPAYQRRQPRNYRRSSPPSDRSGTAGVPQPRSQRSLVESGTVDGVPDRAKTVAVPSWRTV